MQLHVDEASSRLDELVDRVIAGEHIVIALDDGTEVRLEPIAPGMRQQGEQP